MKFSKDHFCAAPFQRFDVRTLLLLFFRIPGNDGCEKACIDKSLIKMKYAFCKPDDIEPPVLAQMWIVVQRVVKIEAVNENCNALHNDILNTQKSQAQDPGPTRLLT